MVRFNDSLCRLCEAPVTGSIRVCDECTKACMELAPEYWEGKAKDKAPKRRTADYYKVDRPLHNLKSKEIKAATQKIRRQKK